MKSTRYYSKCQEGNVADRLHLKRQPNSGATPFAKGDLCDEQLLVECKTLTRPQKTRTVEKQWMTKLKEEQLAMRKSLAAIVFDFGDGDNYVMMTESDFQRLYNLWRSNEES